jgi:hypothetical protein
MVTIAEYYCITAKQDIVGIDGVAVVCDVWWVGVAERRALVM